MGLVPRLTGWKSASRTRTKLDGKSPVVLFLRNRPIHQDPSPAFRHSMRSPSMNPKSLFDSPPHEYVALHQQGNRVGSDGIALAIIGSYTGFSGEKGLRMILVESRGSRCLNVVKMPLFHLVKVNWVVRCDIMILHNVHQTTSHKVFATRRRLQQCEVFVYFYLD